MESERYENTIREYIEQMPPSLAQAIGAMGLPAKIQAIGKKNDLRLDQLGVVERELFMVLVGVEHPDTFARNLVREAHLSTEQVAVITRDVNEQIIAPIRSQLVEMHEKEKLGHEIFHIMTAPSSEEPPLKASPTESPEAQQSTTVGARTLGADIAQAKLSGNVHLPSDSMKVKEVPAAPPPPAAAKPPSPVEGRTYATGADPYREPPK